MLKLLPQSQSQLRQDLFALAQLNFKNDGFFVEFGATNGMDLSNSFLLEKHFGWSGILAEPDVRWHRDLKANRTALIDIRLVAARSGEPVSFTVSRIGENSGISEYVSLRRRLRGRTYNVETLSLNDLLELHNAPEVADYISTDTEGGEAMILKACDLSKWRFRVATIEHNFMPQREEIYTLMTQHGYKRVFEDVSSFDDWYIQPDRIEDTAS